MIEILSNPNWINPQIDFLLFLQNIRMSGFDIFNNLFLSITIIGEFWLPMVICAVVYWCIDLRAGIYLFSLTTLNMFFAHLFKMIACVYRPWVLSDKIKPVEKALAIAAGYSFPSGHSAQASATLGGLAFLLRKNFWFILVLILLVLLVGFSRLWLGVHTPQDVVVGICIGFSLVFFMNNVVNWAEKDTKRYLYLLGIINAAVISVLIFICYFNHYPADYVDGKLLVDPRHSIQASIFCYGCIAGLLSGTFLCRRFFPFNPKSVNLKIRIFRGIIGSIMIILLCKCGIRYLFCDDCNFKIVYLMSFINGIIITAIYPYIFQKLENLKS